MLVIGKAEKSRSFKAVKSLLCQYRTHEKSWMDSEIFADYVRKLDMKFHARGRKVALITDNFPVHPNVDNLKTIALVFLPPNATSKTQPMDQGAIRTLKAFYRTNIVRHQIKYIDAGETIRIIKTCSFWSGHGRLYFRGGISQETQVASIQDEDNPFKMLAENVNDLTSRGLIDENLVVDVYMDYILRFVQVKSIL